MSVSRDGIAVIGMACLFPGAADAPTFWRNVVGGVDSVTDPPPEAWDSKVFFDPSSTENDRVYCKRGGFIGPLARFDPTDHGVMPNAIQSPVVLATVYVAIVNVPDRTTS